MFSERQNAPSFRYPRAPNCDNGTGSAPCIPQTASQSEPHPQRSMPLCLSTPSHEVPRFSISLKHLKINQVQVNGVNYVMALPKVLVRNPPFSPLARPFVRNRMIGEKGFTIEGLFHF